jgi:two-component system, cell cycle sensor histidine kinase and response regulator CckA
MLPAGFWEGCLPRSREGRSVALVFNHSANALLLLRSLALARRCDRGRQWSHPLSLSGRSLNSEPAKPPLSLEAKLLNAVQQSVIVTDLAGTIIFWNAHAEVLFGWKKEEAVGRTIVELATFDASSYDDAMRIMDRLKRGLSWSGEFPVKRKDGSRFLAFVVNSPLLDENGVTAGIIGVSTDVSEQRALEERMRQASKMEAIGRLAGGVAHDFNNVLTVILGNTSTVLEEATDPNWKTYLQEVQDAGLRAASLTRQLLTFSRKQFVKPSVLDVGDALRAMFPMLRRLISEDVEMELDLARLPLRTVLDAGQFDQVVLNLCVNARDAMPRGGKLTIKVGPVASTALHAAHELEGTWLQLQVSDTGTGISAEALPRVFEPFFTTKDHGRGTGLGLATVHGIVTQSGGSIDVTCDAKGTTFHVLLPRTFEATSDEAARARTAVAPAGRTILLCEDEEVLRVLLSRVLVAAGYRVLSAESGERALLLAANQPEIDLLLTDIVMPGINGVEVAERLRANRAQLSVLLMSGYSEEDVRERGARLGNTRLLQKPFLPEDLLKTVADALAR